MPLARLDAEWARLGWSGIDFVKIDAEGEEARILAGARSCLGALSPLVMFEIRTEGEPQLGLVADFAALGYRCWRLLPGLGVLAPFDPAAALDPYVLNLYACKPDRARRLAARGLLADADDLASAAAPATTLQAPGAPHGLEALPFGAALAAVHGWHRAPVDDGLAQALALQLASRDHARPPAWRAAALRRAFALLEPAPGELPPRARAASFARIAFELGERTRAVAAVGALYARFAATRSVDLSEPFLPPLARYEALPPGDGLAWLASALLEAQVCWGAFSTFFSGTATLPMLQLLERQGFADEPLRRRLALVSRVAGAGAHAP